MQKMITKPVVQRKTHIEYYPKIYDPKNNYDIHTFESGVKYILPNVEKLVGDKVIAQLDPSDSRAGTETGPTEQNRLMNWLNKQEQNSSLVKGHLLNHDLGGLGISENLFPITTKANSVHKNVVELPVKELLVQARDKNVESAKAVQAQQAVLAQQALLPQPTPFMQPQMFLPPTPFMQPQMFPQHHVVQYTVQVQNHYSFATGVPDEFVCHVQTGYYSTPDCNGLFTQESIYTRTIKSDLKEKIKSKNGGFSISDLPETDYILPKGKGLRRVREWDHQGKEWKDMDGSKPSDAIRDRSSLVEYTLTRGEGKAKKDMGSVKDQGDQDILNFLTQLYGEKKYFKMLTVVMDSNDIFLPGIVLRKIATQAFNDMHYLLLYLYIQPSVYVDSVFEQLMSSHWQTLRMRDALLVAILRRRGIDSYFKAMILSSYGIAMRKLDAAVLKDPSQGTNALHFKTDMETIFLKAGYTEALYKTDKSSGVPQIIVEMSTLENLDENGMEAVMSIVPKAFDWEAMACAAQQDHRYKTSYYIFRVLYMTKTLKDSSIMTKLRDTILQNELPPLSLFEICHELNQDENIVSFRKSCFVPNLQEEIIENFKAADIMKFAGWNTADFLKPIPNELILVVRKCISENPAHYSIEDLKKMFIDGILDIKDMENTLSEYITKHSLQEVLKANQAQIGTPNYGSPEQMTVFHDRINDYILDALEELPPNPGEDMSTYCNRVILKTKETAWNELGTEYNDGVATGFINCILATYQQTKNLEREIIIYLAANQHAYFLQYISVSDIFANPALLIEEKRYLLVDVMFPLLLQDDNFEHYFNRFYGLVEEGLRYGFIFHCDSVFDRLKVRFASTLNAVIGYWNYANFLYKTGHSAYLDCLKNEQTVLTQTLQTAISNGISLSFAQPLLSAIRAVSL
ncbi:MAG: hypothetical protein LBM69_04340 [Lachnospiraceae bacterium]|jgi:hypothetical protein|nr:hypothetical protein [Lachnospiraceae bacterium]